MTIRPLRVSLRAAQVQRRVEGWVNGAVRLRDRGLAKLRLGGRIADYDDENYSFIGGEAEVLRKRHYDKSLRLLWKAQIEAPWSSFRDATSAEREIRNMALRALTDEERAAREVISSQDYRDMLKREYTLEQRQAIVTLLSAIGHGEAYAWLVSARLLGEVRSTGAKAALTMQVLEEAKHFVVLRELIEAFEVDIPRLPVWEYDLLEAVLAAEGVEKLFGMNVVVEGIALSIFGILADMPGLEILHLFHKDEARHTALPLNYLGEFPMSWWERNSPRRRMGRLRMILPALPLVFMLEKDAATIGIDAFDLGGAILGRASKNAERAGFLTVLPYSALRTEINLVFNAWCFLTRPGHEFRDFIRSGMAATEGHSSPEVTEQAA